MKPKLDGKITAQFIFKEDTKEEMELKEEQKMKDKAGD